MKKTIFFILSLFSLIFLSCDNGKMEEILVESITLSETELTMKVGETEKIIATIFPENAINTKLSYSSTDKHICTYIEVDG